MRARTLIMVASALAAVLASTACSPAAPTSGADPSTAPTSTAGTAASSGAPSAAPSATPSASDLPTTAAPSPSAVRRTEKELAGALLGLKDVPPGLSVEKGAEDAGGVDVRSADRDCRDLVRLLKTQKIPGTTASAAVSFSGGQDGPFVDQTLDAMGAPASAAAVVKRFRAGLRDCAKVTLTIPGAGTSSLRVREISLADIGDDSTAARFTASSGPLEGFELIQVAAHSDDVLLGMALIGFDGADAEQAATDAMAKVEKRLGTGDSI